MDKDWVYRWTGYYGFIKKESSKTDILNDGRIGWYLNDLLDNGRLVVQEGLGNSSKLTPIEKKYYSFSLFAIYQ